MSLASLLGRPIARVPDEEPRGGITPPGSAADSLSETAERRGSTGPLTPAPPPRGWVRHPGEIPSEPDRGFYLRFGKRGLDLVLGGLATLLLLPLFVLCALAIKLDTPGPVIYSSPRVGRGGRIFTFYKLRSMVHGADRTRQQIAHLNEVSGPVFKIARDPRITRVGRLLRRSSVDELPQILNVLKGEMTLVGPRPPIPEEVAQYEPWQLRRLSVAPGITCLWQISGRSRLGFDEWMRLDMEYVERRSFTLDLKILARTIPAVLGGKGAY